MPRFYHGGGGAVKPRSSKGQDFEVVESGHRFADFLKVIQSPI